MDIELEEIVTTAQPAIADGMIYLPLRDESSSGFVHAYDLASGDRVWSYETGGLVGSDIVASDGRVFAATADRDLYALNSVDGSIEWHLEGGSDQVFMTIDAGQLLINSQQRLTALDIFDGAVLWDKELEVGTAPRFRGHPALHEGDIIMNASTEEGILYSIDPATREINWIYDPEDLDPFSKGAIRTLSIDNGLAFTGGQSSSGNEIHAVALDDGELQWVFETEHIPHVFVLQGDKVFLYGQEGNATVIQAIDQHTGEDLWYETYHIEPENISGNITGWAATEDHLIISTGEGVTLLLDADSGAEQWRAELEVGTNFLAIIDNVIIGAGRSWPLGETSVVFALDGGYQ